GAGFIVSGYCPGTSLVSAASGNIDGMLTFLGVIVGSVLFGEMYPWVAKFYLSGHMGQVFLYELLGVPPAVVALGVAVMAAGCFLGAEWVERWATRTILGRTGGPDCPAAPRRIAFGYFAAAAALGIAFLLLPVRVGQAKTDGKRIESIDVITLAHRVIEEPWRLRIIDVRDEQAFLKQRIPGSEHSRLEQLGEIGLQYSKGIRDLVLVGAGDLAEERLPDVVRLYPGRIFLLKGGFEAWRRFALTPPPPLKADASEQERQAYQFRAGLHAALTGAPAPPPPKNSVKFKAPPKRKGGGCS
ncbi:MAG: YeeE/YedE family protein, partial [Planctomycetes bacterium]|nr:YeeE/YedE family protein [Planctomycetota bacterium]